MAIVQIKSELAPENVMRRALELIEQEGPWTEGMIEACDILRGAVRQFEIVETAKAKGQIQ